MDRVPVDFSYQTSFPGWPAVSVRVTLTGSWGSDGRRSSEWSSIEMAREVDTDGCVVFRAIVLLDSAEAKQTFEWGAFLSDEFGRRWAIPTEIKEKASTRQTRVFVFSGKSQREVYYLTHCRRLGANTRELPGVPRKAIQFSVWAPNARSVEVVAGTIYDQFHPEHRVPETHVPAQYLAGGFISDRGDGIDANIGAIPLKRGPDGVWESDAADPRLANFAHWDHRPYIYRLVRDDGSTVFRSDLYSRCQVGRGATTPPSDRAYTGWTADLEGRVSCSAVVNPDTVVKEFEENPPVFPEVTFVSDVEFWQDEWTGMPLPDRVEDLVIYELHMGALGFGSARPGSLEDVINFLDYLVDLGINAVELLPLSQFGGGAENWGYGTSHYFAIEYAGGGRDQFKHLIKACHRRGLAVIMDVVYNHFDQEADRAERAYDSPAPERDIYYWYEGIPADYASPRGGYIDNQSTGDAPAYHEEMVRKMFISSAVALMREFHVDGLRVDQTTSIHAYNRRVADGAEVPDANIFGAKLLRELGRTLRLIEPGVMLIAEDHSSWEQVTQPIESGGMGFDARWFSEFYHHLIGDTNRGMDTAKLVWVGAAFSFNPPSLRMDLFADQLALSGQAKVVFNESHDEAGNSGGGPFLDPDWDPHELGKQYTSERTIVVALNAAPLVGATREFAEARCRFAYGMTVFSGGTPMFLFGEEVGAQRRFKYNKVLENKEDYLGLRSGWGRNLFCYYAAANQLRRRWPGLRSRNIEVVHVHNDNRVLAFRRWEGAEAYLVIASLSDVPYLNGYYFESRAIWDGAWREIFNSDAALFGGQNIGNLGATLTIVNGAVNCVVPANGLVILQRVGD